MRCKVLMIAAAVAFALEAPPGSAVAQEPDLEAERGVPVYERVRPELEPPGLRAGAFVIRPSLRLGALYSDNIYATRNNRESDLISTVSPELQVESDWSRHQVRLDLGGTAGFYADNSSEDFVDAIARLSGRLDVLRETFITGSLSYAREHEERGDPDVPLANDEPSVYYVTDARVAGYHGAGRLSLMLGSSFTRYDFRSVDVVGGGSRSQSGRDRNIYEVESRVAYELLPNVIPFVQGSYNWRRYDTRSPVDQNSTGYRIGVGSGFDAGGVITGEVFAGYMRQNYESASRVAGLWFGGSLLWNVTRLTSVQLGLRRSVEETQTAVAYRRTAFDSRIDHELLRNLLIGAFFDVRDDRYSGSGVRDRLYEGGPRVSYLWNRNLSAEVSLSHRRYDSNQSNRRYRDNRAMLAIVGRF